MHALFLHNLIGEIVPPTPFNDLIQRSMALSKINLTYYMDTKAPARQKKKATFIIHANIGVFFSTITYALLA